MLPRNKGRRADGYAAAHRVNRAKLVNEGSSRIPTHSVVVSPYRRPTELREARHR